MQVSRGSAGSEEAGSGIGNPARGHLRGTHGPPRLVSEAPGSQLCALQFLLETLEEGVTWTGWRPGLWKEVSAWERRSKQDMGGSHKARFHSPDPCLPFKFCDAGGLQALTLVNIFRQLGF